MAGPAPLSNFERLRRLGRIVSFGESFGGGAGEPSVTPSIGAHPHHEPEFDTLSLASTLTIHTYPGDGGHAADSADAPMQWHCSEYHHQPPSIRILDTTTLYIHLLTLLTRD